MTMTPDLVQAQQLFSRGSDLLSAGQPAPALACFQQARELDPANPWPAVGCGAALHELSRYGEAIRCYGEALAMDPELGAAHNNLGNTLLACGRFPEAVESFTQAHRRMPSSPEPLTARATALQALGRVPEAEADCRRALAIDPAFAAAHWNLALNLLLQGRYGEGWPEYEWRWQKPGFTSPVRHGDLPQWDGSPLMGRTILLHAEQGFGDALQFVRYVPLVARAGGQVVLECHPQLVPLFETLEGVQRVLPFGAPLPQADFQAPLLSLPYIFNTSLSSIPDACPYLSIPNEYRSRWQRLLSSCPRKLRVGLVWAGKSYPDPLRSCRLSDLAPLGDMADTLFFSLQIGQGAEQAASPPAGMGLVDLTGQVQDFADSAALIDQLDLVISIDTAVAHLAGALGKPVWLLLPFAPDWRWLLERSDSPWYPTMHLFRQQTPGDWDSAIAPLVPALAAISRSRA